MPKMDQEKEDLFIGSAVKVGNKTLRKQWCNALENGNPRVIDDMLEEDRIDPNFPATWEGGNPLKTVLLADGKRGNFHRQTEVVQILIENGCELRVRDHNRMIPADYAMLSANLTAAHAVVRNTIVDFYEQGIGDYKPDLRGFFATCIDDEERAARFKNLQTNFNKIGNGILGDVHDEERNSHMRNVISDASYDYWCGDLPFELKSLPKPDRYYIRAMAEYNREYRLLERGHPIEGCVTGMSREDRLFIIQGRYHVAHVEHVNNTLAFDKK